jgi:hypothetical protein
MFKGKTYNARAEMTYGIIAGSLLLLSLLALIWMKWEAVVCYAIGAIFGFIDLLLLVKGSEQLNPANQNKGAFYGFGAFRYLVMILGIGVPTLVMFLTMPDPAVKARYWYIMAATVPFLIVSLTTVLIKPDDSVDSNKAGGDQK